METSEIISLLFGVVSAPVGLWIQSLLLRKKYNTELESLRAQVEASKTDTRGDELENVKNGMSILMEQVVEPLKKEINAIRKELARFAGLSKRRTAALLPIMLMLACAV